MTTICTVIAIWDAFTLKDLDDSQINSLWIIYHFPNLKFLGHVKDNSFSKGCSMSPKVGAT